MERSALEQGESSCLAHVRKSLGGKVHEEIYGAMIRCVIYLHIYISIYGEEGNEGAAFCFSESGSKGEYHDERTSSAF